MTVSIDGNGTLGGLTSVSVTGPVASSTTGSAGPMVFRNKVQNGNFVINQRRVTGTVTLAAGAYGHDRWKAGASGCTYTFATSGVDTVITITAGSLIQVIESINVEGGTYVMSWFGTAQGKIGGGIYSASGVTQASITAATNLSVEFNTGTLSRVQVELGTLATTFERRPIQIEMQLCQRYAYAMVATGSIEDFLGTGGASSTGGGTMSFFFPVEMRVPATGVGFTTGSSFSNFGLTTPIANSAITNITFSSAGTRSGRLSLTGTGAPYTIGQSFFFYAAAGFGLIWTGADL